MARYIDADALLEKLQVDFDKQGRKSDDMTLRGESELSVKYNHGKYCYLNAMEQVKDTPTADVVPKSEPERLIDKWIGSGELTPDEKTLRLIEALRDEAKRYERYYFNHEYDKLIGEAKAEVAREIIDKIESVMFDRFSNIMLGEDIRLCLAELKKKYTEGEPNGSK